MIWKTHTGREDDAVSVAQIGRETNISFLKQYLHKREAQSRSVLRWGTWLESSRQDGIQCCIRSGRRHQWIRCLRCWRRFPGNPDVNNALTKCFMKLFNWKKF